MKIIALLPGDFHQLSAEQVKQFRSEAINTNFAIMESPLSHIWAVFHEPVVMENIVRI